MKINMVLMSVIFLGICGCENEAEQATETRLLSVDTLCDNNVLRVDSIVEITVTDNNGTQITIDTISNPLDSCFTVEENWLVGKWAQPIFEIQSDLDELLDFDTLNQINTVIGRWDYHGVRHDFGTGGIRLYLSGTWQIFHGNKLKIFWQTETMEMHGSGDTVTNNVNWFMIYRIAEVDSSKIVFYDDLDGGFVDYLKVN